MYTRQPPARAMFVGQEVAEEVRRRFRDRKLDISKYKRMPQVQLDYRKERGLQPHDVQEM
jgi:DNA-dependent RNA polymerase auxiliary subunit epsilon